MQRAFVTRPQDSWAVASEIVCYAKTGRWSAGQFFYGLDGIRTRREAESSFPETNST
jgi:hypothetical protein